ncbi:MAG TPA: hypothetical protein VMH28_05400 [Candidatus Acidoferrales bacterium]|nr:hypothetical protein [Candidatus Acidoferrales bacterium]
MNDLEFKRHLKDLAHGHHHPEEHDWETQPKPARKAGTATARTRQRAGRKPATKRK